MQQVYGTDCIHCGHPGAFEADHVDALKWNPHQPIDPHLLRPSHGSNYPCPVCPGKEPGKGKCCNQVRGTKPIGAMPAPFTPRITW